MPISKPKFELYKVLLAHKTDFHFFKKNTKKLKQNGNYEGRISLFEQRNHGFRNGASTIHKYMVGVAFHLWDYNMWGGAKDL